MKKKRVIAILSALSLFAGVLAGCGSSSSSSAGGASAADTTASTQAATTAASTADAATTAASSADTADRPTFTIATVRGDTDDTFLHTGIMKELQDEAGININWKIYTADDWPEQKSLLFAADDLPDAFFSSQCLSDADVSQNKASLVELTDLIDQNMPNLKAVFEKEPQLLAKAKDRNGEIYGLVKKLPLRPKVNGHILFINQKWLDNLGLEVPTTEDELTDVLKKFASEDADGDGDPTNEIPISMFKRDDLALYDLRTLTAPFGTIVSRGGNYMQLSADGVPTFVPATDNFKAACKWMNEMYDAGVVDPEYFTQDESSFRAKIQKEGGSQIGLFAGWTADAEAGPDAGEFTALKDVAGPDGKHYQEVGTDFNTLADNELVITKKCSDPAKLLQWADLFYTDLATLQTYYGSIPDQISDNGDGTYTVLTPKDGESLDRSAWKNSFRDFGPKYMNEDFYDKVKLPEDQGDGIKLAQDYLNEEYVNAPGVAHVFPNVKYTDDEQAQLSTLGTDIYKYVEAQFAHWTVDGGIDDEWDAYIKQLNDMGLQQFMDIQNTAYQAYLDSMKE